MWTHKTWSLFQSFFSHNFLFNYCMAMNFSRFVHNLSSFVIQFTEWKDSIQVTRYKTTFCTCIVKSHEGASECMRTYRINYQLLFKWMILSINILSQKFDAYPQLYSQLDKLERSSSTKVFSLAMLTNHMTYSINIEKFPLLHNIHICKMLFIQIPNCSKIFDNDNSDVSFWCSEEATHKISLLK